MIQELGSTTTQHATNTLLVSGYGPSQKRSHATVWFDTTCSLLTGNHLPAGGCDEHAAPLAGIKDFPEQLSNNGL
jgi:hypothetical protein